MWTSIKQIAVRLYGAPRVHFVETSTTLVIEATTDQHHAGACYQLYDELLGLPSGSSMRHLVRGETCIFLIAVTTAAMARLEPRYADPIGAPTTGPGCSAYRQAA